jgi:hypothetical protein
LAGCIHSVLVLIKINVKIDKEKITLGKVKMEEKALLRNLHMLQKTVRKPSERECFGQELVRKDSGRRGWLKKKRGCTVYTVYSVQRERRLHEEVKIGLTARR